VIDGVISLPGPTSIEWEEMNLVVLAAAVVTVVMILRDSIGFLRHPAVWGLETYHLFADVWLVGILPVTLYPFLGGRSGAGTGVLSPSSCTLSARLTPRWGSAVTESFPTTSASPVWSTLGTAW
jgi:hypothetical protein